MSDDNAFAESVMRTIKYNPAYPDKPFADLDEARAWVATFVVWYNHEHMHSGIQFVSPAQRHLGLDIEILAHRHRVYVAARARHPRRWTGNVRNWSHPNLVVLNPERGSVNRSGD